MHISRIRNFKNKFLTKTEFNFIAIDMTFFVLFFYSSLITYPTPRTVVIILALKASSIFVLKNLI